MQSFRAYRIHKTDGIIEGRFETLTEADLSEGDVLIKAQFSSINYKDALAATGKGRILKSFPLIGGIDVAGVVAASDTDQFVVGQPVVITGCGLGEEFNGGYSEYVRAPASSVVALPDNLSTKQAMMIGTAGFTAALAITRLEHNDLAPDKGEVLVTGATGGVGSHAIAMLARRGYSVVALTRKQDQNDYLLALGATRILQWQDVDPGSRPLERALWAGAIDNVGGEVLTWLTRTTNWWGSIASIGLAGGHELNTTVMPFILRGVNLLGINSVLTPRDRRLAVWQRLASDLLPEAFMQRGVTVQPFAKLPELFDAYMSGTIVGRTVIDLQHPA